MNNDTHRQSPDLDALLDRAVDALREHEPPENVVAAATDRVWSRLAQQLPPVAAAPTVTVAPGDALRGCDDVRALMPALVAGTLPSAQRLLVEDHARSCIPCRKALQAIRAGKPVESSLERERAAEGRAQVRDRRAGGRQLLAAAVLAIAAVTAWFLISPPWLSQDDLLQVKSFDGQLVRVGPDGLEPLYPGDWIDGGDTVRSAGGASALVQLADGSMVEVAERSSFSVARRPRGLQLRVDRGSVIVEASEQGPGSLGVTTEEMLVAVKGTIFAVSHGSKGSRVSVIEGEVAVETSGQQGRKRTSLYPGDQLGTRSTLRRASFAQEIGWSQNFEHYLEMLEEFKQVRHSLNQIIASTEPRTSTRLLDLAPADTVVYVGLPNPTSTFAEVYALLRERMQANPALYGWWQGVEESGFAPKLDRFVQHVQELSQFLGPETVIALSWNGDDPVPLVLSEVTDAESLREALRARLADLQATLDEGEAGDVRVTLLDGTTTMVSAAEHQLFVWVGDDLLAITPQISEVNRLASGAGSGFAATPFRSQVARAYEQGADYLGAVDLGRVFSQVIEREVAVAAQSAAGDDDPRVLLEMSGFSDVRFLVVERHHADERAHTAAELTFGGTRKGLAAWLAQPGPMGALDFVSPDATFVSSFLSRDPAAMLDDLFAMASGAGGDQDLAEGLAEAEAELGIDLRDDLAAPLGGEVAFALDGPALPVPSWKLIVEVYDPSRLQWTLQTLLQRAAEKAGAGTEVGIEESLGRDGRTYYRIYGQLPEGSPISGAELHYTYVDGYLVAAPSKAMVERAIQTRDSRASILTSEEFRALLPSDGYLDFSAVVFNRLGAVIAQLVKKLPVPAELSEEQRSQVQGFLSELSESTGPSLYALYGEEERIRLASNSPSLVPFAGLGSVFGLGSIVGELAGAQGSGLPWQ
ncbi:MAG TPA: FecR domain-containing protein [Thermoanaerobaculia bacterium]|nr:FecR domain-containing protein [Thermoanaerobaculia bacterium]